MKFWSEVGNMWHKSRHPLKIIVDGILLLSAIYSKYIYGIGIQADCYVLKREKSDIKHKTC